MNPKTTQNWNPTRTQKLPKSYPSWVLIGFIWVPTGFRWVPQKGFRWGPVGFRLGSGWVPFGFLLASFFGSSAYDTPQKLFRVLWPRYDSRTLGFEDSRILILAFKESEILGF